MDVLHPVWWNCKENWKSYIAALFNENEEMLCDVPSAVAVAKLKATKVAGADRLIA